MSKPDSLNTPEDCAALAAHEWDTDEVVRELWSGREQYLAVRAEQLRHRLKGSDEHADRNEPEAGGDGLA